MKKALSARRTAPKRSPQAQTYSLKEVAAQVGVELRVLRSWMGSPYRILPGLGRGSGNRYPQHFFDRAMLVQRLRADNLGLAEIANRLRSIPDEQLEGLLVNNLDQRRKNAKGSAADYAAAALTSRGITATAIDQHSARLSFNVSRQQTLNHHKKAVPSARVSWERTELSESVEIHARRPMSREENRKLEALMKEAGRIFGSHPDGKS